MALAVRPQRQYHRQCRYHRSPYAWHYNTTASMYDAPPFQTFRQPLSSHVIYPFSRELSFTGAKWTAGFERQLKNAIAARDNARFQLDRAESDIFQEYIRLEELKRNARLSKVDKRLMISKTKGKIRRLEANKKRFHSDWNTKRRRVADLQDLKRRSQRGGGGGGGGGGRGVRARQRVAVPVRR